MSRLSEAPARIYNAVTAPYKRLWKQDMLLAIAIPIIAAVFIPFSAGFAFSGLTFSEYLDVLSIQGRQVIQAGSNIKERIVWDCAPGLAVCYALQPSGWSWNDIEFMNTLKMFTGGQLPTAKFEWLSPLLENPSLILPS